MSKVKINNKEYDVPELTFKHTKSFERAGVPLAKMVSDDYLMNALSAFVQITAGVDEDGADFLIEQHVEGGGDIAKIAESYVKAVTDSHFFKKLLKLDEKETKPQKLEK